MIKFTEIQAAIEAATKPEEIDHHGNDLYCKVTPATTAIINDYESKCNVTTFIDNINSELWYEIPFCYVEKPKKTCKTCLLYEGFRYCCSADGVKETDICDRYEPNPVIYL